MADDNLDKGPRLTATSLIGLALGLGVLSLALVSIVGLVVIGVVGAKPHPKIINVVAADDSTISMAGESTNTVTTPTVDDAVNAMAHPVAGGAEIRRPTNPQIANLIDSQVACWNNADLLGYLRHYWKSTDVTLFADQRTIRGSQAIQDYFLDRYLGPGQEMGRLTISHLHVDPIDANLAVVRAKWKLAATTRVTEGTLVRVIRKLPEGWRIVHEHLSVHEPAHVAD